MGCEVMWPGFMYNMPIPGMDQHDEAFYRKAKWQTKFLLWPQRCALSNKLLWLCHAHEGTAVWTGPGTPVFEFKYHNLQEHLIWKLKGY